MPTSFLVASVVPPLDRHPALWGSEVCLLLAVTTDVVDTRLWSREVDVDLCILSDLSDLLKIFRSARVFETVVSPDNIDASSNRFDLPQDHRLCSWITKGGE